MGLKGLVVQPRQVLGDHFPSVLLALATQVFIYGGPALPFTSQVLCLGFGKVTVAEHFPLLPERTSESELVRCQPLLSVDMFKQHFCLGFDGGVLEFETQGRVYMFKAPDIFSVVVTGETDLLLLADLGLSVRVGVGTVERQWLVTEQSVCLDAEPHPVGQGVT